MRSKTTGLLAMAAAGLMLLSSGVAASAGIAQSKVVSANPADSTPQIPKGTYASYALQQVGSTMYAGGQFSTLGGQSRSNIGAFSATSPWTVNSSFKPNINGSVWAIEDLGGGRLAVGGDFTTVNGVARRGLAVVNASTGAVDTDFDADLNGRATSLNLVNGRLIAGGAFTKKLQAVNPVTGKDTGYLNLGIQGAYVYRTAVYGTRLVAVANITSVSGQARRQAFMVDLGATSGTLASWYYQPLLKQCAASSYNFYLRDVDFSPNGDYFVLAGTGFVPKDGDDGETICDAAARFDTNIVAPVRPKWINYTGGDTLHSVTVSGAAVYVGGHQRWLDNPDGRDTCVGTCTPRPGIGAIHPTSGRALTWNPSRTRGVGAKELLLTQAGLWVGSDTGVGGLLGCSSPGGPNLDTCSNKPLETHSGIGFLPLS